MRTDRDRLLDVLEAIERIEKHTRIERAVFDSDELIQIWTVHHLQIIGEAVHRVSAETRATQAEIPWSKIIGMRNILVHRYFSIDTDIVWAVVENDLMRLKRAVQTLLEQDSS